MFERHDVPILLFDDYSDTTRKAIYIYLEKQKKLIYKTQKSKKETDAEIKSEIQ